MNWGWMAHFWRWMAQLTWMVRLTPLCIIAGCISRPPPSLYVLSDPGDSAMDANAVVAAPVLQLQPVLIPDYLDTTDIDLRVGPHELQASRTGRWGERLSTGITHALRADLAARLPVDSVVLALPAEKSARQILVTVDAFDVWADGHCVLIANWSLLESQSRAVLNTGKGTFVTAAAVQRGSPGGGGGDGEVVKGMADAVGKLADSVAAGVKALPP
ncbi:MAG TPA: PqiC family protein [Steroidobacteraceae bacterium]|nr:PqiC family protein [Steroidobacteraceae bacterium]